MKEFSQMVQQIRATEKSIGSKNYKLSKKQEEAKAFSRSLYISKEIKKGEIASKENIKSVRPGYSLHPKHLPQILGKKAKKKTFPWEKE